MGPAVSELLNIYKIKSLELRLVPNLIFHKCLRDYRLYLFHVNILIYFPFQTVLILEEMCWYALLTQERKIIFIGHHHSYLLPAKCILYWYWYFNNLCNNVVNFVNENVQFIVALKWYIHIPFISVDEYLVFFIIIILLHALHVLCHYVCCDLFHILLSSDKFRF